MVQRRVTGQSKRENENWSFAQKTSIYQEGFLQLVLCIIQQTGDKTYFAVLCWN